MAQEKLLSTNNFTALPSNLKFQSHWEPVISHPLLQTSFKSYSQIKTLTKQQINAKKDDINQNRLQEQQQQFLDPLGAATANAEITTINNGCSIADLLTPTGNNYSTVNSAADTGPLDNTLAIQDEHESEQWPIEGLDITVQQLVGFKPWIDYRQRILDQFVTGDRLTLESTFLTHVEIPMEKDLNYSVMGTTVNKRQLQQQQKQRISGAAAAITRENKRTKSQKQALEKQQNVTKFYDLTQEEWCRKLMELRRQLQLKWREEKRLDCIQLISELVAEISGHICSAQFYPAQFVHITDMLDLFGWLVWQRLYQLAQQERRKASLGPLPTQWTINDVLGDTRLKARNWFGKINETIKMLTPRIYLLAAILPCQRFMDPWPGAAQENLLELCRAAEQVQHPLISSYLRCYLCRAAMRVQPADRAPHWKCLNDWLQTYAQQPISLLWPAMEWIIQCVAYTAVAYEDMHPLWEYCRRMDRRSVVLVPMLNALPDLYLGEHALEACRIVTSTDLVTGNELYTLGRNLLRAEIPHTALKPILRSAWKRVLRLGSMREYLECCECWCQFVVRHFTANELQVVLDNLLRKLHHEKCELYFQQLQSILCKIFIQSREIRSPFGMDVFAKFFDIFRAADTQIRVHVSQVILSTLVEKHLPGTFTDVSLAYQVLSVCQLLHDSTELCAPINQITTTIHLVCCALDRVELRADPEQCLEFFMACRAELSNWDGLQRYVIRRVQTFTLYIVRTIRYTSSRAAFLQGCLANLFISIPTVADPFDRIELAIQSAQIALAALLFLQVQSFVDFVLDQFREVDYQSSKRRQQPEFNHKADLFPSTNNNNSRLLHLGVYFLATLATVPLINEWTMDDTNDEIEPAEDVQRASKSKSLQNFARFLNSISSFSEQHLSPVDRIHLLIRCLQYLSIVQLKCSTQFSMEKTQTQEDMFNLFGAGQQLEWTFLFEQNGISSDDADNENQMAEFNAKCAELAEQIAQALEPGLLCSPNSNENVSDSHFALGMELLELIAHFDGDDQQLLPARIRTLAKSVYKQCRRRPELAERVQRLKAAAATQRGK